MFQQSARPTGFDLRQVGTSDATAIGEVGLRYGAPTTQKANRAADVLTSRDRRACYRTRCPHARLRHIWSVATQSSSALYMAQLVVRGRCARYGASPPMVTPRM